MFTDPVVQWTFTILFSLLTAYSVLRVFLDWSRPLQAIGHVLPRRNGGRHGSHGMAVVDGEIPVPHNSCSSSSPQSGM